MTTTENRPAGRGLDAQIAEKVMGWTAERIQRAEPYIDESGAIAHDLPPYSTDIAAAWEVVEKVKAPRHDGSETSLFTLEFDQDRTLPGDTGAWMAGWALPYCDGWPIFERAETAPLAICLAALKAVEKT